MPMALQDAATWQGTSGLQAKLSFAHAETLIPLACLLGLFGPQDNKLKHTALMPGQDSGPTATCQRPEHSTDEAGQAADACADNEQPMGEGDSSHRTGCDDLSRQCSVGGEMHAGKRWEPPLPKPPNARSWKGSVIAPYGANIQFVLYRCQPSEPHVSILHLQAVRLPKSHGCPVVLLIESAGIASRH